MPLYPVRRWRCHIHQPPQQKLQEVEDWCEEWFTMLNPKKTQPFLISSGRMITNLPVDIRNSSIKLTNEAKLQVQPLTEWPLSLTSTKPKSKSTGLRPLRISPTEEHQRKGYIRTFLLTRPIPTTLSTITALWHTHRISWTTTAVRKSLFR